MNDHERQKLYEKLEKDTEEYFKSLKPTKYEDGWKEDNWEQEMEQHPLFATGLPEDGHLPPLVEALQQLKYDESDNTPEQLARSYKEDGNECFRKKNFHGAVAAYTEGLKQNTMNQELRAQLFNNRSTANFYLKNYNASLEDALEAMNIRADYPKASLRAAQACWELRKIPECMAFCDEILKSQPENAEIKALLERATREKLVQERNARKRDRETRLEEEKFLALKRALKRRNAPIEWGEDDTEFRTSLTPTHPALLQHTVHLDKDGALVWPVTFLYPDVKQIDAIQAFNENTSFGEQLNAMFGDQDGNSDWRPCNLNVWFRSSKTGRPVHVTHDTTLGQVLGNPEYYIQDGTPFFWVTVKNSEAERTLLRTEV